MVLRIRFALSLRVLVFVPLVVGTASSPTRAAGLIYELPPDGSWALFRVQHRIWDLRSLSGKPWDTSEATLKYTLTLRSVGTLDTSEGPGRWIELESNGPPTKEYPGRIIVLKMLIPEKYLTTGSDPLAHIEQFYYWSRNWELDQEPQIGVKEELKEPERIRYEIERFRPLFPFPSREENGVQITRDQTIKTPFGKHTATKIVYPMQFAGKLSGGKRGRWTCSGVYTLWLSSASPFGVVAVETEYSQVEDYESKSSKTDKGEPNGEGARSRNNIRIEFESTGTEARSVLPEFPKRREDNGTSRF